MKLIRESLFEKFIEDSDPIKDMGIGMKSKRLAYEELERELRKTFPGFLKESFFIYDYDKKEYTHVQYCVIVDGYKYTDKQINDWLKKNFPDFKKIHIEKVADFYGTKFERKYEIN